MASSRLGAAALLALWLFVSGVSPARAAVPAGFEDTLLTKANGALALAFTPDGRLVIAGRTGLVYVYKNGALLPPALNISSRLCWDRERGVNGIAVDPDFPQTHYIYLYYTYKKHGTCEVNTSLAPVNRMARFTLRDDNVIDPASEAVLLDNIPSPGGGHNAGDLGFGKDGYLYVSVGDGYCDYAGNSGCAANNDAARDRHVLLGKILRITPSGGIPADNPWRGTDSARCNLSGRTTPGKRCQETWAWGLRNPFRLAFDPTAIETRIFINDVGERTWEEIDLGQPGADYGWNVREGPCARGSAVDCGSPPPGMTDPIYAYLHGQGDGCASITGGAFVPPGVWPSGFDGAYLFADYLCGKVRVLKSSGAGYAVSSFATDLGPVIDIVFGPHGTSQALYYTAWKPPDWEVHRIASISGNRTPVPVAQANPRFGSVPLTVSFSASGSSDPDGDALTYDWDFGDGTPHATTVNASHTYSQAGTYTATLRTRDSRGASASASLRIDAGNSPPAPSIISPSTTARFYTGQTITLRGTAGDFEDRGFCCRLSWEVLLRHNTHFHPFLERIGNDIPFTTPSPESLADAATTYLQIRLTATDSKGLARTVTQDLRPELVNLTFATEPSGLELEVDGNTVRAPRTLTSWRGHAFRVNAPNQTGEGRSWNFTSWSDGGARSHVVTTPASPTTYIATYVDARCGGGVGTSLVLLMFCGIPYYRHRRRAVR